MRARTTWKWRKLLGDAALPGEAAAVIDKAVAAGKFTEQKDKDRAARLSNSLKPRAEADKKGEAAFDAEAAKNAAGELDTKSGEVYFGSGDYQSAVTAITPGIEKKGIKHPDEAYVYLGRSQVALKNTAEAKKAFSGLKSVPNISPRVLKLWELYFREARLLVYWKKSPAALFVPYHPGRHPAGRPLVVQTRSCAFVGHQLRFRWQKVSFLPASQQGNPLLYETEKTT